MADTSLDLDDPLPLWQALDSGFRRDRKDRAQPHGNVTAELMGDPKKGRSALDKLKARQEAQEAAKPWWEKEPA